MAELGRIDIVVNMASIYEVDTIRPDDRERLAAQHRRQSALRLSRVACRRAAHATQGGGRIINFADWLAGSGRPAYKGFVAYYTAKAGVIALTEALALELGADQILVNAVAPGPILPPPDISDEERDEVAKATPIGRWGGAIEIAKAVRMLVETDFITGETVRVDGGRHVR